MTSSERKDSPIRDISNMATVTDTTVAGFNPPLPPTAAAELTPMPIHLKKSFISCNTQGCCSEVSIHSDLHFIQEVSHSVLKYIPFTKY